MCAEVISFNAELSPPTYGLPSTMQRMIREVSDKRQAAIDFALGPALGAASIAIGSRITLNAKLADILAKAKETIRNSTRRARSRPSRLPRR